MNKIRSRKSSMERKTSNQTNSHIYFPKTHLECDWSNLIKNFNLTLINPLYYVIGYTYSHQPKLTKFMLNWTIELIMKQTVLKTTLILICFFTTTNCIKQIREKSVFKFHGYNCLKPKSLVSYKKSDGVCRLLTLKKRGMVKIRKKLFQPKSLLRKN